MACNEFKKWLVTQKQWEHGDSLPTGYVRQWTYWFYDMEEPIGYGKLRERLTEKSRNIGGNIGYAIASDRRGKGYGYILFKMLLNEAQFLGISEVMSTVEKNNPASKRIQEKCGGKLIKETEERWYFSFDEALREDKEGGKNVLHRSEG